MSRSARKDEDVVTLRYRSNAAGLPTPSHSPARTRPLPTSKRWRSIPFPAAHVPSGVRPRPASIPPFSGSSHSVKRPRSPAARTEGRGLTAASPCPSLPAPALPSTSLRPLRRVCMHSWELLAGSHVVSMGPTSRDCRYAARGGREVTPTKRDPALLRLPSTRTRASHTSRPVRYGPTHDADSRPESAQRLRRFVRATASLCADVSHMSAPQIHPLIAIIVSRPRARERSAACQPPRYTLSSDDDEMELTRSPVPRTRATSTMETGEAQPSGRAPGLAPGAWHFCILSAGGPRIAELRKRNLALCTPSHTRAIHLARTPTDVRHLVGMDNAGPQTLRLWWDARELRESNEFVVSKRPDDSPLTMSPRGRQILGDSSTRGGEEHTTLSAPAKRIPYASHDERDPLLVHMYPTAFLPPAWRLIVPQHPRRELQAPPPESRFEMTDGLGHPAELVEMISAVFAAPNVHLRRDRGAAQRVPVAYAARLRSWTTMRTPTSLVVGCASAFRVSAAARGRAQAQAGIGRDDARAAPTLVLGLWADELRAQVCMGSDLMVMPHAQPLLHDLVSRTPVATYAYGPVHSPWDQTVILPARATCIIHAGADEGRSAWSARGGSRSGTKMVAMGRGDAWV
ncbi:hypothetical protein DFH07DRAFT_969818 [Mycena maculata]|uniref:Uncharacterized protein n=1 Tax=Mycena maculata TaxID=230809 RepID=A0AAD7HUP8_9AGAR|nr:hypothetical protein DFH07DRAFT_969818 [Mycena maculata]